ncbi:BEL1-like homeodomain protein 8 [Nymphaea thermarum]|nr:BEL1-like homeodomain protein 8 [Nymphaea thermarum]
MFQPENNCFPISTEVLVSQKDGGHSNTGASELESCPQPISYSFPVAKSSYDAHDTASWKDAGSHNAAVWNVNYVESPACSLNSMFINNGALSLPSTLIGGVISQPAKPLYLRNATYSSVYPDLESSPGSDIHSSESHKHYQEMSLDYSAFPPSVMGAHQLSSTHISEVMREGEQVSLLSSGGDHVIGPGYGNTLTSPRVNSVTGWNDAFMASKGEGGYGGDQLSANIQCDSSGRCLALSLSSIPPAELRAPQFGSRFGCQEIQPMDVDGDHSSEELKSNLNALCNRQFGSNLGSFPKPFVFSGKENVNTIECNLSSPIAVQNGGGPFGPFTGYSSILKSSKFLRPAQQLLEEFVGLTRQFHSIESNSGSDGKGGLCLSSSIGNSSSVSTSNDISNPISQSYHIGYQHRKMKLVAMLDEVMVRYDYYNQQIKMVVSSFESVAGLSTATPYTSFAVRMISRHFRCLKKIISRELQDISRAVGDELNPHCQNKGDNAKLKYIDPSLRHAKTHVDDQHQHIWRPQRGLPERSVAILRAWLFEHFLHPYPTDTDKHMLASQTGLSRNQVSNWFINARVRIWKPMVEEIHMLETQKAAGMDLNAVNACGQMGSHNNIVTKKPTAGAALEGTRGSDGTNYGGKDGHLCMAHGLPEIGSRNLHLSSLMNRPRGVSEACANAIDFSAYQHGMDLSGLGSVSLTLGLKHDTEGIQDNYGNTSDNTINVSNGNIAMKQGIQESAACGGDGGGGGVYGRDQQQQVAASHF